MTDGSMLEASEEKRVQRQRSRQRQRQHNGWQWRFIGTVRSLIAFGQTADQDPQNPQRASGTSRTRNPVTCARTYPYLLLCTRGIR